MFLFEQNGNIPKMASQSKFMFNTFVPIFVNQTDIDPKGFFFTYLNALSCTR